MEIRSEHLNKALGASENKSTPSVKQPRQKAKRVTDLEVRFDKESGLLTIGGRVSTQCENVKWDAEITSENIDDTKRI